MADKKNTPESAPEIDETAAAQLEQELEDEELLADMPALREPHRLRLRHRNRIMAAYFRAERNGLISDATEDEDEDTERNPEQMGAMLDMLADIDDFAEAIAYDQDAYIEWAEKNSSNYAAYSAIMRRYVSAVGE